VSRKLWPALLVLGLVAAACGSRGVAAQPVRASFLPQAVDTIDDVGRGLSLALDKQGNPHLTYIGLLPVLKEGEIPAARSVDAPALPAVLTADQANGIWTRSDVVQTDITKANGPKVPVGTLDSTATAIDDKGVQHVVWTQTRGLWYSSRELPSGQFSKPAMAADGYVSGPSLAVDADGIPWTAYYVGNTVQVATLQGKSWITQDVATVGSCSGCPSQRTAIAVAQAGPVVAYTDPGTKAAMVATSIFGTWHIQQVPAPGSSGGLGVGMALDGQGNPHVSFLSESGSVFLATPTGPSSWQSAEVGSFRAGSLKDLAGGTAIAIDPRKGTEYVAWSDPAAKELQVASGSGTTFKRITTAETQNGEFPAMQVSNSGKLNVVWYDSVDQDLLLGTYPESLGLFAVPSPLPSATASAAPSLQACAPTVSGTKLTLVAQNTAFDTDCIGAPSGKGFTIAFDNKDADVQHNVEIYTSASATTRVGGATSATDTITGPASTTYQVPGLQSGIYYFQCDVHPTVMTGTLVVK
jgi:plastocyanin